nr:immunoglobulin heavy chain junction region [Macaca mulatta]MOV86758.1 immunoglobulin heavy chain junction region [Macaca mulatta]MOV86914.1 immunoglobulin heavy chain junction region [Macaca mulatta]MOV88534.1 immunoglobulin heavy chain junction region [Macaca mulatta]MOV88551.1 immunoglobulin heavy chain junction region [Macaca mulatta]
CATDAFGSGLDHW